MTTAFRRESQPEHCSPHDRHRPPESTAHLPLRFRKHLVCLSTWIADKGRCPTQKESCPCDPKAATGDFLQRERNRARAGQMTRDEYETLRALGVNFLLADNRRGRHVLRPAAVPFSAPTYEAYQRICWEEALDIVRDAVAGGVDANTLIPKGSPKDLSSTAMLMFNVTQAAKNDALPADLANRFTKLGLIFEADARRRHLEAAAERRQQDPETIIAEISGALRRARQQGLNLEEILDAAFHRAVA